MQAVPLLAQKFSSLGVSGTLVVGAREKADDAQQDGLGCLDGAPPLCCELVAVLILLRRVQNRDAQGSRVRVDVGVKGDGILEGQGWR